MPIARWSSATEGSPRSTVPPDDPAGAAALPQRRQGGCAPRARHRRRRGTRGLPPPDGARRRQRAARPDRPWGVARHVGADRPVGIGHVPTRLALVAVQHRPVRHPGDRPRRRRRHRAELAGAAGLAQLPTAGEYYASPALTTLLRSVPADELADRFHGRQMGTHRRCGTAVPELAGHRHRPPRATASQSPGPSRSTASRGRQPTATTARTSWEAGRCSSSSWLVVPSRSSCRCSS